MADVTLPQLGETVTEGTITQWFKSVGDTVTEDEPLFEVSTDKVDTEVPSPVSGVLTEIRVDEGDTVEVGTVIAVVGGSDNVPATAPAAEPAPASEPALAAGTPPVVSEPARVRPPAPTQFVETAASQATAGGDENRLLSPVVRRLVNEHGLDVDSIRSTGSGGRITRDDVLGHINAAGSAPHESATGDAATGDAAPATARASVPAETPAAHPAAKDVFAPPPPPPPPPPAVTAGKNDRSVRLSKIRRLTGDHMTMSLSLIHI